MQRRPAAGSAERGDCAAAGAEMAGTRGPNRASGQPQMPQRAPSVKKAGRRGGGWACLGCLASPAFPLLRPLALRPAAPRHQGAPLRTHKAWHGGPPAASTPPQGWTWRRGSHLRRRCRPVHAAPAAPAADPAAPRRPAPACCAAPAAPGQPSLRRRSGLQGGEEGKCPTCDVTCRVRAALPALVAVNNCPEIIPCKEKREEPGMVREPSGSTQRSTPASPAAATPKPPVLQRAPHWRRTRALNQLKAHLCCHTP